MIGGRWIPSATAGNCNACGSKREDSGDQVWALEVASQESKMYVTLFCPPCVKDLGEAALRARATDSTASMMGLTDLEHSWNVQAARAGFAGSEFINDPERVFSRIEQEREVARTFRVKLAEKNALVELGGEQDGGAD
jgi:hypothetical protein